MRILQLHCDNISYEPTKKEIKSAEEIDPKPVSIDEVVVCFVAVEKDDTEDVAKDGISQIKESMEKNRLLKTFTLSICSFEFGFICTIHCIISTKINGT